MRTTTRRSSGFTLIELLIVVAIIGILAAIAIPNLLTAIQRAKQKRTMADMRAIATAWEARAVDMNFYSSAGTAIEDGEEVEIDNSELIDHGELLGLLAPTYLKSPPATDGWNQPYVFAVTLTDYGILSMGKNGTAEGPYVAGTQTSSFECDIVYVSGSFIQWPEGLQSTGGGPTSANTDKNPVN